MWFSTGPLSNPPARSLPNAKCFVSVQEQQHPRRQGANTQVEQPLQGLDVCTKGSVSERLMDVAAQWLTRKKHLIDTSIRSVFAERGQHAQAHFLPGTAARLGKRQKLDHCGNCVCPVIFGHERSLGQRGLPTLDLLRNYGKPKPGSASFGAESAPTGNHVGSCAGGAWSSENPPRPRQPEHTVSISWSGRQRAMRAG